MEGSVFSLTRSSEGFGMDLDRRGVIVGYTGSARPAEVAYMPLGAVVTAVDGKEVGFSLPRLLCVCVCVCVCVSVCVSVCLCLWLPSLSSSASRQSPAYSLALL